MVRRRVQALFHRARELEPEERGDFLDAHCPIPEVRAEVESLLAAHDRGGSFLERTPEVPTGLAPLEEPEKSPSSSLPRGFGSYRAVAKIGEGGMGAVYLGVRDDDEYRKRVAIKVVKTGAGREGELMKRFRQERQILANLEHPHIARLLDGGTTPEGRPFFVMEYAEGLPLDQYCRQHAPGIRQRLRLFLSVCAAVHFAHQNLVVHRDLKPSNIRVLPGGEPRLLDFGIAKLLSPEAADGGTEMTRLGQRIATPRYASPEQIAGRPVTTASDIYSLGVVLYELLTGELPYEITDRLSLREIEIVICETEPLPPSRRVRGSDPADEVGRPRRESALALSRILRGDLDNIVLKCLAKEPSRRYGSAEALAEDLRRHLDGLPVSARRPTIRYRAGKFVRRHRVAVAVTGALALAVVLFAVVAALAAVQLREERDGARREAAKLRAMKAEGLARAARALHRGGMLDEAQGLYLETLDLEKRLLGEEHAEVAVTRAALAAVYCDQGNWEEADRSFLAALAVLDPDLATTHPAAVGARVEYGRCLLAQGRLEEAEDELLAAYEKSRPGAESPPVLRRRLERHRDRAAKALAELYTAAGREGEGVTFLRRLEAQEGPER